MARTLAALPRVHKKKQLPFGNVRLGVTLPCHSIPSGHGTHAGGAAINETSVYDSPINSVSDLHLTCGRQAMARTLAALHSVRPADVGLASYGKLSGYNKRQVRSTVVYNCFMILDYTCAQCQ